MLSQFVSANRDTLIARCLAQSAIDSTAPQSDAQTAHGVPVFLEQLTTALRRAEEDHPEITSSGAKHGEELLARGVSITEVVRDYGRICQAITTLAVEQQAPITAVEFKMLNLCLDEAVAGAVSEYSRLRTYEGTERLGVLAHELRNSLSTALLSFELLKDGTVGIAGSTGNVLGRSLAQLGNLIDRELADVRLDTGVQHRATLVVQELLDEVALLGAMEARSRGLHLSVAPIAREVTVHADRPILVSVISNLLHNAFKFTHAGGQVRLRARATAGRVLIDVEDECGGLPPGKTEALFLPYVQTGANRSGLGLGLAICQRGAMANEGEVRVANHPGSGCVFTLDLPLRTRPASA